MEYVDKLPDDAKLIPNSTTYVDRNANFYSKNAKIPGQNSMSKYNKYNHHYEKYRTWRGTINKKNGYVYVFINYTDRPKSQCSRRAHVVVAEMFCPNPDNLPIVCHKNNIKSDCRADNLYWGTAKQNTAQAIKDGIFNPSAQTKGYTDSQSKPVIMFDRFTNKELGRYGSASEAAKETGYSLTTILRQSKYKGAVRKPFYFRFQDDPDCC